MMIPEELLYGIYQQYLDAVFRLCLRSVTRRKIAEEITGEVFLSLHQSAETVTIGQLEDWLLTAARQRCAGYWRTSYLAELESPLDSPTPTRSNSSGLSLTTLLSSCPNLTPVHRICLILRFSHGMSCSGIAEQTGLSETQVTSHVKTSLKLLRHFLAAATAESQSPSTLEISTDA